MRTFITYFLVMPLLVLTGCGGDKQWHEKITLTIETPIGEVSGYSVQLAGVEGHSIGDITPRSGRYVNGEAVVLKLPINNQPYILFALLQRQGAIYSFYEKEIREHADPIRYKNTGIHTLPPNKYPLLVTFDDINDPASVREVNPNDLAATFGEGYSLKSITLEITDEPVTGGQVEKVLGWLESVGRERAGLIPFRKNDPDYQALSSTLRSISPSDFSTELYK